MRTQTSGKQATIVLSKASAETVINGFGMRRKALQSKDPVSHCVQSVMTKAVAQMSPSDSGINVCGGHEVMQAISCAVSYASAASATSKKQKAAYSRTYTEVNGQTNAAIADFLYGGKCKYCGKKAEAYSLLINLGACHKARCVRNSMQDNL